MKKKLILFVYLLLLCIGLQYETTSYTYGSMTGTEYGIVGLSIFLSLFYIIPAICLLYVLGKKWGTQNGSISLSLLGGMFISGWMASFANSYIHDAVVALFPDSQFWNTFESAIVAPLVEEPLKLIPIAFAIYFVPVKNLKSLFLLGISAGLGFQIVEDFAYINSDLPEGFSYTVSGILGRMVISISSHWIYTALAVLGVYLLLLVKQGNSEFKKSGLLFLFLSLGTHFIRNTPFSELETELPFTGPLVSAMTLFAFYLAYQFVSKHEAIELK